MADGQLLSRGATAEAKTCNDCKVEQPLANFDSYNRTARGGRLYMSSYCRPCRALRHDPLAARKSVLRTRYKLQWDEFLDMLAEQGGGCGVCGSPEPGGKGHWHIDHDHACCPTNSSKGIVKTCGKCVRGVLCHLCNTSLGCARDDVQILQKMIDYLTRTEGGVRRG